MGWNLGMWGAKKFAKQTIKLQKSRKVKRVGKGYPKKEPKKDSEGSRQEEETAYPKCNRQGSKVGCEYRARTEVTPGVTPGL